MAAVRCFVSGVLLLLALLFQCTATSQHLLEVSLNTVSQGREDLTIDLTCSLINSSEVQSYNTLQWLDGELPITQSASREIIRCGTSTTLRFRNFSVLDFGMYSCRCVNLYSFEEYERQSRSITPFCSQPSNITHLPEGLNYTEIAEIYAIEAPNTTVTLECNNGSSQVTWTKINSTAVAVLGDLKNLSVVSPRDQGKFVCHERNTDTVHKIVYVYIPGYQPIRIFYPESNRAEFLFTDENIPMCNAYFPFPESTATPFHLLAIKSNSERVLLPRSRPAEAAAYHNRIVVAATTYLDRNSVVRTISLFLPSDELIDDEIRQKLEDQLEDQQYVCTFSNRWESISVKFNLTLHAALPQPTSIGLPITSTAVVPSCQYASTSAVTSLLWSYATSMTATNTLKTLYVYATTAAVAPLQRSSTTSLKTMQTPTVIPTLQQSSTTSLKTMQTPTAIPTLQRSSTTSLISMQTPTAIPTLQQSLTPPEVTAVAAATVVFAIAVLASLTVVVILLWRRRHRNRRGKITRRRSSIKRLLISEGEEWLRGSKEQRNSMTRLSLTLAQQEDTLQTTPPVSFMYDGVPISRQLATCFRELEQSQWLFPFEDLQFEGDLGSGAFGIVRKAQALSTQPGKPSITVAVKTLKDVSSDEDVKDMIWELKVLQHVGAHPNVVSLLGAAIHHGNLHIIVEYCCDGNLLHYLRSKRKDPQNPLCTQQLVGMAGQIAKGMEHLASKNCIHRDLAARNVLIAEDFILKVADFGLARKMYHTIYKPSGGKIPVKWMAPESIIDREYTSQSDVWSFGVLLWEIMTLGQSPYPGKSPEKVLKDVGMGYRMPQPPKCPQSMYHVMSECWQTSPRTRPNFSELCSILEEVLQEETLPNHYYNILDDASPFLNDTSDQDSDSTGEGYCQCSYTKEDSALDTSTSTSVFCSHCKLNHREYINNAIENIKTRQLRQAASRLDSNDSGIRVQGSVSYHPQSVPGCVTEVDDSTTGGSQTVNYLEVINPEAKDADYLRLVSGSKISLAISARTESLQSLCSNCRVECDGCETDLQIKQSSTLSLCSACKLQIESENSIQTEAIEMELTQYPSGISAHAVNSNRPYYNIPREEPSLRTLLTGGKIKVEAQYSNDSGMMSICSDRVEVGCSCSECQCEPSLGVASNLMQHVATNDSSDNYSHLAPLGREAQDVAADKLNAKFTHDRLSAHPKHRTLFHQLGIQESDL